MRQCELKQAIEVLTDNEEENTGALKAVALFPTSAVDLALCHALLGDLVAAEKCIADAEVRASELSNPSFKAAKAFARAVVDCRAGRHVEAARMLEEGWPEFESMLTGDNLRPVRVVRAFAIAANPRNVGLAETVLGTSRSNYPGEFDFLGAAWPEMSTFLATHNLSSSHHRAGEPIGEQVDG